MSRPTSWPADLPYIDTSVKHIGVSQLRQYNSAALRKLDGIAVIRDGDEPLAVLMPYQTYLEMQTKHEGMK